MVSTAPKNAIEGARAVARGGIGGGGGVNPPNFFKINIFGYIYSTYEIYLLNRKNIIKLYCQYKI